MTLTAERARQLVEEWFEQGRLEWNDPEMEALLEDIGDDPEEDSGCTDEDLADFTVKVWPASLGRWAFAVRWREPFNRHPVADRGHVLPWGEVVEEDRDTATQRERAERLAKAQQRGRAVVAVAGGGR